MAGTEKKRMTAAEKRYMAEFRERMRAEGIMPQPKKPLNRKKFIQDARKDFDENIRLLADEGYIISALVEMAGTGEDKPTLENIGAAKVMKLACEIKRFTEELRAAGRDTYTVGEYIDRMRPIYKA